MDIHKPKAWHGFRGFLKEYLIIVIGVLTALGAEQLVENLHWRREAAAAREEFRADNLRIVRGIGRTDILGPCMDRRLNELQDILEAADARGRLPAIGEISMPPGYGWFMRGWEGATSSGVIPHLAPGEGGSYAAMRGYLDSLDRTRDDMAGKWVVLRSMSGPGRRLSPTEAADLRQALNGARAEATKQRALAHLLGRMVLDTHLNSKAEILAAWKAGGQEAPTDICRPIDGSPYVRGASVLGAPPTPPEGSYEHPAGAVRDSVEK